LDRTDETVVFRNPENLHAFLTDDTTCRRLDLWAIAQILRSRKRRVSAVNEGSGLGAKKLDIDLKARHDDILIKRGDVSNKIIWQNLQEGRNTALMDEFLRL